MSENEQQTALEEGHQPPAPESWLGRHAPYVLLLGYLYYCTQIAIEILGEWWELSDMLPITAVAINVLFGAAFAGLALRVVGQVIRRASLTSILRNILGEPSWWRTWYPRALRNPASVWDSLPAALKLMRTALWLGLLVVPAGVVLLVFVIPTFEVAYASMGVRFPLMMRTFTSVVTMGAYVFPLVLLAAFVEGRRWRAQHGLSSRVAFNALFSVNGEFWRRTEARKLLTH